MQIYVRRHNAVANGHRL